MVASTPGSTAAYTLVVACLGGDGALSWVSGAVTAGSLPSGFTGWASLGGRIEMGINGGPAVMAVQLATGSISFANELTFFVNGTDGHVWKTTVAAGPAGWATTGWACLGHLAAGSPASGGTLTSAFACQGTDHAVWAATSTGSSWDMQRVGAIRDRRSRDRAQPGLLDDRGRGPRSRPLAGHQHQHHRQLQLQWMDFARRGPDQLRGRDRPPHRDQQPRERAQGRCRWGAAPLSVAPSRPTPFPARCESLVQASGPHVTFDEGRLGRPKSGAGTVATSRPLAPVPPAASASPGGKFLRRGPDQWRGRDRAPHRDQQP